MPDRSLIIGLAIAAASSGCAPILSLYGQRYPGPLLSPLAADAGRRRSGGDGARAVGPRHATPPPGSTIEVLTMDGGLLGTVTHADGYSVRVLIDGIEEQIARADVLRVDLLDLPGSEAKAVGRGAVRGAVVGLGAAALLAGVIGGGGRAAALLRGGAALGGVAGGKAALLERGPRPIYLAEDLGQMRRY